MIKKTIPGASCASPVVLSLAIVAMVLTASPVLGQGLEEVIVRARKKEEKLQQVPIAVTAVSGAEIALYGMDSLQEIGTRIPALQMHAGGSGQGGAIWFRGIGAQATAGAFESSLAFNVDGAVVTTPRIIQNSFFDVKGFEVLKGPQPTSFGKAATAGVISLSSNNPTDEFEGKLLVSYEAEQDSTIVDAVISGPVSKTLNARLAARTKSTDEMIENIAPGVTNPNRGEDSTDLRLTLDFQATAKLNLNLKVSDFNYENDGTLQYTRVLRQGTSYDNPNAVQNTPPGSTGIPDVALLAGGQSRFLNGGIPYSENDTTVARLQANYQFNDDSRLVATISKTDIEDRGADNYGLDFIGRTSASLNQFDITSLELRLESVLNDRASYMVGGYYEDHNQLFDAEQFIGLGSLVGGGVFGVTPTTSGFESALHDVQKIHDTDSKVKSLFGQFEFDVSERLKLILGGRYTDVSKNGTITVPYVHDFVIDLGTNPAYAAAVAGLLIGDPAFGPAVQSFFGGAPNTRDNGRVVSPKIIYEDSDTNLEAIVDYSITDQQRLYVAYKEAFKPGGIDNSVVAWNSDIPSGPANSWDEVVFDSENVTGYELGYKSFLLDRRLRINAVLYNYNYKNFQVQTFNSASFSFSTGNAGKVSSQGLEVDFDYAPAGLESVRFRGSLAWDQSEFDEFTNRELGTTLDGRRLAHTPKFSANLGANLQRPVGATDWQLQVAYNFRYSGEYFTENSRLIDLQQDAFITHDLVVGLSSPSRAWDLSVAAINLSDEIYTVYSNIVPGITEVGSEADLAVRENVGRNILVALSYHF